MFLLNMDCRKSCKIHVADEMAKDKDKWVDFMMRYELGLEKPDAKRARKSALILPFLMLWAGLFRCSGMCLPLPKTWAL